MTANDRHAVLILEGATAYDSVNAWNREVARIIRKANLDVVTLNVDAPQTFIDTLRKAVEDYPGRIATALSFSGFGAELGDGSERGSLWQNLNIPLVTLLLDHPAYVMKRHSRKTPAVMRVYPNHDFLHFHRDYVKSPYRTTFCGFGAMGFGREPQRRTPKPGEAPLIMFPKTGNNPKLIEETWKLLPRVMQRIIRDAVDHYWGQTSRSGPVVNSVLAAADGVGVELRNDMSLFTFFIAQLDDYVRRSKADILIRQLLTLPVKIFGGGLDYIDTSNARAEMLAPISFDDMVAKAFEALAVVSMNQNIDHECHDRPYIAMAAGAMPISDVNPWWEKNYPALMPYSYDFRNRSVIGAVEKILADPEEAASVAWNVSLEQRQKRTFENTVIDTLELAIMHRYFTFNFQPPQHFYFKHED